MKRGLWVPYLGAASLYVRTVAHGSYSDSRLIAYGYSMSYTSSYIRQNDVGTCWGRYSVPREPPARFGKANTSRTKTTDYRKRSRALMTLAPGYEPQSRLSILGPYKDGRRILCRYYISVLGPITVLVWDPSSFGLPDIADRSSYRFHTREVDPHPILVNRSHSGLRRGHPSILVTLGLCQDGP